MKREARAFYKIYTKCARGVAGAFFALNSAAFAQNLPDTSNLRTAEGLAYECKGNEGKFPLCVAHIIGVFDGNVNGQVLEAMQRGDSEISPSYCPPPELTYGSMVQLFLVEFETFPESKGAPSVIVMTSALRRTFPCI